MNVSQRSKDLLLMLFQRIKRCLNIGRCLTRLSRHVFQAASKVSQENVSRGRLLRLHSDSVFRRLQWQRPFPSFIRLPLALLPFGFRRRFQGSCRDYWLHSLVMTSSFLAFFPDWSLNGNYRVSSHGNKRSLMSRLGLDDVVSLKLDNISPGIPRTTVEMLVHPFAWHDVLNKVMRNPIFACDFSFGSCLSLSIFKNSLLFGRSNLISLMNGFRDFDP